MIPAREFLSENEYLVTFPVDLGLTGVRLDVFLKERYRKRSREAIKRAIDSGAITVRRNQGPHVTAGRLKPSFQLLPGDEVLVLSEKKPEPPVSFDYRVIFEDESLLVIDKPAHLPVHPAGRYFFNTLLVHLQTEGFRKALPTEREHFLVHRIDKETSGVLVLAKTKEVCAHLTRQFATRTTGKWYLAIAHGETPEEFTVDLPIMRSTRSVVGLKMMTATIEEGGFPSLTEFRRLQVVRNRHGVFSLVECRLRTGRQHQIRVHLDAVGHPIVGDKLYGRTEEEAYQYYERKYLSPEAEARLLTSRHALHAARMQLFHPLTEETMEFSSPLPSVLENFLRST